MTNEKEIPIEEKILSELRQTDGKFGVAFLQIKYHLIFSEASRIVDYFIENGYAEKGDFGCVTVTDSSGDDVECRLGYRITKSGNL